MQGQIIEILQCSLSYQFIRTLSHSMRTQGAVFYMGYRQGTNNVLLLYSAIFTGFCGSV